MWLQETSARQRRTLLAGFPGHGELLVTRSMQGFGFGVAVALALPETRGRVSP